MRLRHHGLSTFVVVSAAFAGCVAPTNPFDPQTPAEQQAKGAIVGRIALDDPSAGTAALVVELGQVTVTLTDPEGRALQADNGAPRTAELDIGNSGERVIADFTFLDVVPGRYGLDVAGVGSRYVAPTIPRFDVTAGDVLNLGAFVFAAPSLEGGAGPGSITGAVRLEGGAGGARSVELFRRGAGGPELFATARTNIDGAFTFTGLPIGGYAIESELEGFTPGHIMDIAIGEGEGQLLAQTFVGDDAIVLHPVTAVLLPTVQQTEGQFYTRDDSLPLNVLAFGGVTAMRLGTDVGFRDVDAAPVPFTPYNASAVVPLPARQGPIDVFGQFEARGDADDAGAFVFVSPTFKTTVVRDATAPTIATAAPAGIAPNADGSFFLSGDLVGLSLAIEAFDEHSAVAGVAIVQATTAPDAATLVFDAVTSPGGAVSLREPLALTAGDGNKTVFVFVRDRAGNVSAPTRVVLVTDTTAPTLPLLINNLEGGVLRTRTASVVFDESGATELPAAMQIGQAPLRATEPVQPYASTADIAITGPHGTIVQIEARLFDDAGNSVVVRSNSALLTLTATVSGRVSLEGVPQLRADNGGASVRLVRAGAGPTDPAIAETLTSSTGTFALGPIPEGDGYVIEVRAAGYAANDTLLPPLFAGQALALPTTSVRLARGELAGRFLLADQQGAPDAHGGILVVATLGGLDRRLQLTAVTTTDGTWRVLDVPVSRLGEAWTIEGVAQGYARGPGGDVEVAEGAVTVVTPNVDDPTLADPVLLQPNSGDFDLCAPTGACVPLVFTNLGIVRVRLRNAADVTQVRVRARQAFAEGDAQPPFVAFDTLNEPTVDITGADGTVDVFVQVIANGSPGPVLRSSITRDTVPPTITSFATVPDPDALDPTFTQKQVARAVISANPGEGNVAPLASARLAFAASAPAAPPPGATPCVHDLSCDVALPRTGGVVEERAHTLFGFSCDLAGNCSQVPQSARIIHDRTPPSGLHGITLAATGPGVVTVGQQTFTRSPSIRVLIGTGTARTGAGAVVTDLQGQAMPDALAYRLGLDALLQGSTVNAFEGARTAGASRDVQGPGLPGVDGTYEVFAQLIDAAGNKTAVEPNPFSVDVTLDTSPPAVGFSLNAGAVSSTSATVTLSVTPNLLDQPVRVQIATDDGLFQVFSERAFPFAPGAQLFSLPAAPAPGGDGDYTVFARFFDAAGNSIDRQDSIRLDRTAPVVRALACEACRASGAGLFTNAADRQVVIDAAADDTGGIVASLRARIGAGVEQTFTPGVPFVVTLPADGPHTIFVAAIDDAGNRSADASIAITLDRAAPTAAAGLNLFDSVRSVAVANGGTSRSAQPRFGWSASSDVHGAPVQYRLEVSSDPTFSLIELSSDTGTGLAFVPNGELADRTWSWRVIARDQAGNLSTSATQTFTVDRRAPSPPTLGVVPAFVNGDTTISWAAADADTATFGIELLRAPSTTPVFSVTQAGTSRLLRAGTDLISSSQTGTLHTVRVRSIDAVGNESAPVTATLTFDALAPCQLGAGAATIRLNNSGGFVDGIQFTQTGATLVEVGCNGELPARMRVNCDGGSVAGAQFIAFQPTFTCSLNTSSQGAKQATVAVYDDAGNESLAPTRSIFFDNTVPSTPRFATPEPVVGTTTVNFAPLTLQSADPNGASGAGFATTPYEVRTTSSANVIAWNGTSTLRIDLVEGDNAIRVRAVDRANNASDEDLVIVKRDTSRPTVTGVTAEAGNADVVVRWSSPNTDVARFEVLYGPLSSNNVDDYTGSNADQGFSPIDVGTATTARLTGLPNGTPMFVAVRAFDAVGPGVLTRLTTALTPNEVPLILASSTPSDDAGIARGVAYADGLAYVVYGCNNSATGCTSSAIRVFDLNDPSTPTLVGERTFTDATLARATDIAVLGDRAYVADGTTIRVFSVANPTVGATITLIQNVTVPQAVGSGADDLALAIAARPGQVFVAAEKEGLLAYDISTDSGLLSFRDDCNLNDGGCFFGDTFSPGFPLARAVSVAVQGNVAYVGNGEFQSGQGAAQAVDVTTSTNIAPFGTGSLAGLTAWSVEFHGDNLYLAQNGRLRVHAIGNSFTATLDTDDANARSSGQPRAVAVAGPYAYVVDDDGASRIKVLSTEDRPSNNREMRVVGEASTTGESFFNVCDTDPGAGVVLAVSQNGCSPSRIQTQNSRLTVAGNLLLEANMVQGLRVYRIGKPTRAREIAHLTATTDGNFGAAENGQGLAVKGRLLMNAGRFGVGLHRIDNPAVPTHIGTYSGSAQHHVMELVEDTLYLARTGELEVLRMTNSSVTNVLSTTEGRLESLATISYGNAKHAAALHVRWPFAYVLLSTDGGTANAGVELKTINLRTQAVTNTLTIPNGSGFRDGSITYHRDRLYITRSFGPNVTIVNITTRATPSTTLGSVVLTNAAGVAVQGTQLFVGGSGDLSIFDLTSVDSPALLGTGQHGGALLAVSGDHVFSSREPRPTIVNVLDPSAVSLVATPGRLRLEEGVLVVGKHVFYQDRDELSVVEMQ